MSLPVAWAGVRKLESTHNPATLCRIRHLISITSAFEDDLSGQISGEIVGGRHADYVVTEYGVAELRGKTLGERMDAMIQIGHPPFRDDLRQTSRLSD